MANIFAIYDIDYIRNCASINRINTQMNISNKLKLVRDISGLNIKDFSLKADLPYRTMQSYLNGEREPNPAGFKKICSNLNVNLNWLISDIGEMFISEGLSSDKYPINKNNIIDEALFDQIISMLEMTANKANKRWSSGQLAKTALRVYQFLIEDKGETAHSTEKINRVLRLVVNN